MRQAIMLVAMLMVTCSVAFTVNNRVIMESSYDHTYLPSAFALLDKPTDFSSTMLDLHFAIKQNNLDNFLYLFNQVSDPQSQYYGKHKTWEQIEDMIADPLARATVISWLEINGVYQYEVKGTGDWVVATMNVATAEKLLQTEFSFIKTLNGREIIRALMPYSLPSEIAACVDLVGGVNGFIGLQTESIETKKENPGLAIGINPQVAQSMMGCIGVNGTSPQNSQAVAQFLNQYYAPSDLSQFQRQWALLVQPVAQEMGTNDENLPGIEASLDIEYIMAVGQNISTWFVSTSGRHEGQEPFLDWIQTQESTPDSPWIHSVSYGDKESSISSDYLSRCETEFQKFGTTGRTIFFASGDDGVGCTGCISGDQSLVPNWPATSPSVTSVGGMILEADFTLKADTISSGGFSNVFPQESWQTAAVSNYLATAQLPNEFFNTSNRAVPDIAAFSEGVSIVYKGKNSTVGGTSCASPTVAGFFALLNDVLLENNKPTLGFLNPLIYQIAASNPSAFSDSTTGENSHNCCSGFNAAPGWDPITGFGLPYYPVWSHYILQN